MACQHSLRNVGICGLAFATFMGAVIMNIKLPTRPAPRPYINKAPVEGGNLVVETQRRRPSDRAHDRGRKTRRSHAAKVSSAGDGEFVTSAMWRKTSDPASLGQKTRPRISEVPLLLKSNDSEVMTDKTRQKIPNLGQKIRLRFNKVPLKLNDSKVVTDKTRQKTANLGLKIRPRFSKVPLKLNDSEVVTDKTRQKTTNLGQKTRPRISKVPLLLMSNDSEVVTDKTRQKTANLGQKTRLLISKVPLLSKSNDSEVVTDKTRQKTANLGLKTRPLFNEVPLLLKSNASEVLTETYQQTPKRANLGPKSQAVEKKTYLRHYFVGRLGNVLFQYASIYCLAERHHLTPVFRYSPETDCVRDLAEIVLPAEAFNGLTAAREQRVERCCCCYDETLESNWDRQQNYSLWGYLQSWKYFEPCKEDVLRALAFKDVYIRRADDVLRGLRLRFRGQILVGVHVRREDFENPKAEANGRRMATGAYFARAMSYFLRRFSRRRVVFVVFTSSRKWWHSHVAAASRDDGVAFQPRSAAAAVDLEVLSRLDHVIISVGTFGWWAAYRNNGTVVYFKDFYVRGLHYGNQFRNDGKEYVYPGWIGL